MSTIEVIGLGAMNMDQVYRVERILSDGEAMVEEFGQLPGGSAANTVYGLARLGVGCGFVGAVGDDEEGQVLVNDLKSVGVDTTQVRVKKGAKTGSVVCLADREGRRALYILPGANSLLHRGDVDPDYLAQARILHLSSFVGDEQLEMQRELITKIPPSARVSFAPGSIYAARGLDALEPIMRRTHILFLNREEAEVLTGEGLEKGARMLLDRGCHIVAITLGEGIARGKRTATCYIASGGLEYSIEVDRAAARPKGDTIGAGDAFAAGFLYGLLHGKELEECGYLGDMVARLSSTKSGARAGLPTAEELSQRYHRERGLPL